VHDAVMHVPRPQGCWWPPVMVKCPWPSSSFWRFGNLDALGSIGRGKVAEAAAGLEESRLPIRVVTRQCQKQFYSWTHLQML